MISDKTPANKIPSLQEKDIERLFSKISFSSDCWNWKGTKTRLEYGLFFLKGYSFSAHRLCYQFFLEKEIPLNKVTDHLCRNHSCVNPFHLEVVTNKENIVRGNFPPIINSKKTHCKNGHPFDKKNTYLRKNKQHRSCILCKNSWWQRNKTPEELREYERLKMREWRKKNYQKNLLYQREYLRKWRLKQV